VGAYTAAKGGIKMLTRAMSAEWAASNIRANAIGPGYILTDMNQALIENAAFDAWVKSSNPSQRWGKPEELVGTAGVSLVARVELCERANHLRRWRLAGGSFGFLGSLTPVSIARTFA
jgi:NAD(P)-dependent dehydrogenase (short-subunit alcohol dehydrogenase family)